MADGVNLTDGLKKAGAEVDNDLEIVVDAWDIGGLIGNAVLETIRENLLRGQAADGSPMPLDSDGHMRGNRTGRLAEGLRLEFEETERGLAIAVKPPEDRKDAVDAVWGKRQRSPRKPRPPKPPKPRKDGKPRKVRAKKPKPAPPPEPPFIDPWPENAYSQPRVLEALTQIGKSLVRKR